MRFSDAAKVGLAALAAIGLIVWVTYALRGPLGGAGSYLQQVSFTDARGLQPGATVQVRGVSVGQVHDVGLGSRGTAVVTLRISDEYRVRPDDLIQIVGGTLGFGQPYINILPEGRKEAAVPGPEGILPGDAGPKTENIVSRSEELLTNLNGLVQRLNRLTEGFSETMNDPQLRQSFTRTAKNFEQMSTSGVVVAKNLERTTAQADRLIGGFQDTAQQLDVTLRRADRLMASFGGTARESEALMRETRGMVRQTRGVVDDAGTLVRNTNQVVKETGGLVGDFRGAIGENREKLREVFDNLNGSLKRLNGTLEQAQSFLGDTELRGDLKSTAANMRVATENLNKLTQDLRTVTADPKVQADLKDTLANLRDATQEAAETFRRVRTILGGKSSPGQRLKDTEVRVDLSRGLDSDRTRLDVDATLPWGSRTFYRLGLFDLGDDLKLNAQVGKQVRPGAWLRGGIHASRLGLGMDFGKPARPLLGLDLYGLNHPRLDARGYIPVGRSLDLTVGLDNVTRDPDPVVGLRYRR